METNSYRIVILYFYMILCKLSSEQYCDIAINNFCGLLSVWEIMFSRCDLS